MKIGGEKSKLVTNNTDGISTNITVYGKKKKKKKKNWTKVTVLRIRAQSSQFKVPP